MELTSIASGSSGNCICVGTNTTHVLVDAGISGKKIENGLNTLDLTTKEIQGVLITHEHLDHIAGLGVIARRYGLPMYGTKETIEAILQTSSVGKIDVTLFHPILPDQKFTIGDLEIEPMSISHDAANPVAYLFGEKEKRAGVVTDLGTYTEEMIERLKGLDALLLEANHDVRMLETGPYPYPLKRRILGNKGHLCNEASGRLLGEILHDHFQTVILGHLSKENNMPELAYETVRQEINLGDNPYFAKDFRMIVAKRDSVTETVTF